MATSQQAYRQAKIFRKVITFTGAAGLGAVGTIPVATMAGAIVAQFVGAFCSVDLAGATATLELGVTGDTAELIAQTTATTVDANMVWESSTPDEGVTAVVNKAISGNVILTVGTAAITAGSIEICIIYYPLTSTGFLS